MTSDPISCSPNPRPKITVPAEPSWSAGQMRHLADEYNTMVDEIELLSGRLAALGVDPRAVVLQDVTMPQKLAPAEPEDPDETARLRLVESVRDSLEASELLREDMILTDVVVVAAQRGVFDASTGTSLVATLIPTDTPQFVVHGLLDMSKIEATQRAERIYGIFNGDGDEE